MIRGLNNCNGIAFSPEGKLKAVCETRTDVEASTSGLLATGTPVVAELNIDDGGADWAVAHGASNNISDITIDEDNGMLFSYENLDSDKINIHQPDDFQAVQLGESMIEGAFHAMSLWLAKDLKVATNVDGPKLFVIDPQTGEATFKTDLELPEPAAMASLSGPTRRG